MNDFEVQVGLSEQTQPQVDMSQVEVIRRLLLRRIELRRGKLTGLLAVRLPGSHKGDKKQTARQDQ